MTYDTPPADEKIDDRTISLTFPLHAARYHLLRFEARDVFILLLSHGFSFAFQRTRSSGIERNGEKLISDANLQLFCDERIVSGLPLSLCSNFAGNLNT